MSGFTGAAPQISPQMIQAILAARQQGMPMPPTSPQGGPGGMPPMGQAQLGQPPGQPPAPQPMPGQHPSMPSQGTAQPPQGPSPQGMLGAANSAIQPSMPPQLAAHAMQMQQQPPMLSQGIPSVPVRQASAPGPSPQMAPGAQAQRSVPINNPNLAMFGKAATVSPNTPQDPSKLKLTPVELAQLGRFGDSIVAHLTPGEIAVPTQVQTPKLMKELNKAFAQAHTHIDQFTAGSKHSSINPKTGIPEYNWLSAALPWVGAAVATVAAIATYGAATPAAAGADSAAAGGSAATTGAAAGTGAGVTAGDAATAGGLGGDVTAGSLYGGAVPGVAAGGVQGAATGAVSGASLGADAGTATGGAAIQQGLGGEAATSSLAGTGTVGSATPTATGTTGVTGAGSQAGSAAPASASLAPSAAQAPAAGTGAAPLSTAQSVSAPSPLQAGLQQSASQTSNGFSSSGALQPGATPAQTPAAANAISSSNAGGDYGAGAANVANVQGTSSNTTASATSGNGTSQLSGSTPAVNNPATTNALSNNIQGTAQGSITQQNSSMLGSLGNWINNNPGLALKLGIAGTGGLATGLAAALQPKAKSPLQSSQYTSHMPAVNSNYQQLLGNAQNGYQPTPSFTNYNPQQSVSGGHPYNFYNPSANTSYTPPVTQ